MKNFMKNCYVNVLIFVAKLNYPWIISSFIPESERSMKVTFRRRTKNKIVQIDYDSGSR